ncbi:glutaredoxin 3 [Prochlorococcus sp. MIT 1223]|uniref:glutaredoxin 3 n=1 Tax=Prochlorococcus sp. MIT 1223 TaxID=3096217 RepID=UPI002A75E132|nr:glutaredoxin 3 [Prochlorococcus sp. MIT 1223]
MAKVEIYTWRFCPFCIRAKELLKKKKVDYIEYAIDGDNEARSVMSARANGRTTVPQIFINNNGIGGCDELYQLEQNEDLDQLLASLR